MLAIKILLVAMGLYLAYGYIPTCLVRLFWKKPEELRGRDFVLSFDDGPSPVTDQVLESLEKKGETAYFFVSAKNAEKIDLRSKYKNHILGFHGYDHINYIKSSPLKTRKDFLQGLEVFSRQGIRPRYFRGPYGFYNIYLLYLLKKYRLKIMQWDYLLKDWEKNEDGVLYKRLDRYARNGNLLVLHDGTAGEAYEYAKDKMAKELNYFLNGKDFRKKESY